MGVLEAESALRLTPGDLERLAPLGTAREYRARTMVVTEGDGGDSLYFVLEGRLRVFLAGGQGRELVLALLGPGEYFGDLAYDRKPRSASVVTLQPCRLLVVPREGFLGFLATDAEFAGRFIAKLVHQVRALTESLGSLALLGAHGRVSRLLMDAAVDRGGTRVVPRRLTQSEIAGRVGCSREMVSRVLKDLVRDEYISLEPDRIVINRAPPERP